MGYRRPLALFVLGAIAVTAVLGLYAVLVPDFGALQEKILGTSAAITIASILLLACLAVWERRLAMPLPLIGAGLTLLTLLVVFVGIWTEREGSDYWRLFGTMLVLALWSVLTSVLALARLPARHRWTFFAAAGFTLGLAIVGIRVMWADDASSDTAKLAGALAVLSAAFLLVVPVLARAGRGEVAAEAQCSGAPAFCPRCGARVANAAAAEAVTCRRCGARFLVSYVEVPGASPPELVQE